ncbi:MAG: multifunctional oxoglutarate decarboxylase/oxoglutarate dehydrogenase thiamine pyrophosphate-binding subunit/dihydrolipoyllysine-residue succinyltransferase subunit [Ignavibacteriales bacterium]|nr:multifunctional oxoglutarate decarboxylase/oxoglutarate dehydrogenase thiamine pyrophosphate-binding subunit/dihydrolipoyllysine-residue succinyltransferase subunit [Ignavibacteriales bacterium]
MSRSHPISPEEKERFGANAWYVESLYENFRADPSSVPERWRAYFSGESETSAEPTTSRPAPKPAPDVAIHEDDETAAISGSAAKILENMETSLTVPVATSYRAIPVKLLEESRRVVNHFLRKNNRGKISFTHLIAWAIVKAAKLHPAMNNAYALVDGKPKLVKRAHINLGLAVDVERRDGSRSLLVPNVKGCERMTFDEFRDAYDEIVRKTLKGTIDPSEFYGATISLTNPGMLGTLASIPRLMTGQGAIIAAGAIQYPAEYQAMSPRTISELGVSKIVNVSNTYDHRVIQGAESGLFLQTLHELLLGERGFYDEVYEALAVPRKPFTWETDVEPSPRNTGLDLKEIAKQGRVRQLINMYRVRGHLVAALDPLGENTIYHEELDPSFYGLTLWDLDRSFVTHDFTKTETETLRDILDRLLPTYSEKIGVEYMHIQHPVEKSWLQHRIEPSLNRPDFDAQAKRHTLKKLVEAEGFEHFIHTRFVGHKRFSLEGSETIVPLLDYLLTIAADNAVREATIGMAHRGRLNVFANIVGKSFESILSEFEDVIDRNSYAGSGDVKYHLGASGVYKTRFRREIGVSLAPNPSHLEWVNPVVEGIVRAKQTRRGDRAGAHVLPILIHGDAAFAGQGVVAETLNLSQLPGYRTGGAIHIIINNQIGFTTGPEEARSSVYATDVAKMVQAPIFHVNGDDPEATLHAVQIAFDYRARFAKDVVLDVFCYRRHGHNEGDEPGFTQPLMYRKIKEHPSALQLYAERLIEEGTITREEYEELKKEYTARLDKAYDEVREKKADFEPETPLAVNPESIEAKIEASTDVSAETIKELIEKTTATPDGFALHPKLERFFDRRRKFVEDADGKADWATAEALAFGSLLKEGTPVRLSGQDSVRGTFSQRHLAVTDNETGEQYFPLDHMYPDQARLEAYDSLLSEAAALGFEYGYSSADPLALVMWEAQFGDFANGAQVMIDNFIVVSLEKWRSPNNVVMLLPHGYEGQGPEHSSARLERFLILCAQGNMEVCYPTTPAQYFHLLRRQVKKEERRPLVVMTPKSLLRSPDARSPLSDFTEGSYRLIIDDETIEDKNAVERLVLTSGKLYYELARHRREYSISNAAIVRLEQYYPLDEKGLREIVASYANAKIVVWAQEEPRNMGAWNFLYPYLMNGVLDGRELRYAGRTPSASPAVGSSRIAALEQQRLIKDALGS